ncbi:hypothetical protein CDAR_541231 [Caerostris darwini]|uniref:Uncharacterized protein n=1 Tax=Caerostris darwini TaxID=1538125 RepID=A0AAV4SFN4_9ARAC|nr:hypothetical protein CDAR_541231 [Caerostris darwini]
MIPSQKDNCFPHSLSLTGSLPPNQIGLSQIQLLAEERSAGIWQHCKRFESGCAQIDGQENYSSHVDAIQEKLHCIFFVRMSEGGNKSQTTLLSRTCNRSRIALLFFGLFLNDKQNDTDSTPPKQ